LSQSDPTDHALAAIASILEHPETHREPEKAAIEETPDAPEPSIAPEQIEAPIVAMHDVARRVLEVARLDEGEPDLPADRIRWFVGHGREGVEESAGPLQPS